MQDCPHLLSARILWSCQLSFEAWFKRSTASSAVFSAFMGLRSLTSAQKTGRESCRLQTTTHMASSSALFLGNTKMLLCRPGVLNVVCITGTMSTGHQPVRNQLPLTAFAAGTGLPEGTPNTLLSTQKLLLGCRPCAVCRSLCSTSKHQRLFSSRVGKRSDEMVRSPLLASYLQQSQAEQPVNSQLPSHAAQRKPKATDNPPACSFSYCVPCCGMQDLTELIEQHHTTGSLPSLAMLPAPGHVPVSCHSQQILQALVTQARLLLQLSSRHC